MKVFTPDDLVPAASDKYLGVLVSAKYARELNALPLERSPYGAEKLTTMALAAISSSFAAARRLRHSSAPAE